MSSLHIFTPGQHTAMSGDRLAFSESDLAATASAYDPTLHEAPLVVGHPRHDAPAYGWVKSLTVGADGLHAEPQQLDAEFAELVASGRFKKISASFYTPDSPSNPVPGVYYLRHVGFLGAQPPAVKGLKQAEFSEAEQGVVEFGELDLQAGMWRRLRDWLLAQFGQDAADRVVPDWELEALREPAPAEFSEEAASATAPAAAPAVASKPQPEPQPTQEAPMPQDNPELAAENARLKQELAALKAQGEQARKQTLHSEHQAFAEQMVSEARLAPAHQAQVVALLDRLAGVNDAQDFGEGDAAQPLTQVLRGMISAQPPLVEFGEQATKDRAAGQSGASVAEFAEADPDRLSLHLRATELAQSKNITYEQAVRQLL
jgi:hypothetical protein